MATVYLSSHPATDSYTWYTFMKISHKVVSPMQRFAMWISLTARLFEEVIGIITGFTANSLNKKDRKTYMLS